MTTAKTYRIPLSHGRSLMALLVAWLISPVLVNAQMTTSGLLEGSEGWYMRTTDKAGELFVFEIGKGKPIVVLHGGPGADFGYMLPIANGLEDDFRFIFYDQRGSLRSRVQPDSISMLKHVQDLEDLRIALGHDRISLISHSAGTMLAYEYLNSYPEHVENVVLTGALPHKNGEPYFDEEYAGYWKGLQQDMQEFYNRPAVQKELRDAGVDDAVHTPKQLAQLALIRQVGAESYHVERWQQRMPLRINGTAAIRTRESTNFVYDYSELLGSHPYPVTVINGEYDYTAGPKGSPLWKSLAASKAPNLNVAVIPDASHNVWYDDPEGFHDVLLKALQ